MFFLLAIISMLGYAVQETLMARYARQMEGLSIAMYRSLSLTISMLPLLFFAEISFAQWQPWLWLALAGFCGAVATPFFFTAQKYLPLGIVSAVARMTVLLLLLWTYLFLGETVGALEMAFVLLTLAGVVLLSLQKSVSVNPTFSTAKGLAAIIMFSVALSFAWFFLNLASQGMDPLVAAYFWETGIAIILLFFVASRYIMTRKKPVAISGREFLTILFAASGTVFGTGAFVLAGQYGSLGIAAAIGASGIVVVTLFSLWLYKEKLNMWQSVAMGVVMVGIVGLKVVGSYKG